MLFHVSPGCVQDVCSKWESLASATNYTDTRIPCDRDALQFSSTCKQLRASILPLLLPSAKRRHVEVKREMQNAKAAHGQMASTDWVQRRLEQTQLQLTDAARFVRLCEIAAGLS